MNNLIWDSYEDTNDDEKEKKFTENYFDSVLKIVTLFDSI